MNGTRRATNSESGAAEASPVATKRDRILAAATELFTERGYAGTTIRQVAERADANSMLIYYYFGSKAELFHAAIGEPARRVRELLERATAREGPVRARLADFASEYLAAVLGSAPAVRAMVRTLVGGDAELIDWLRPRLAANLELLRGLLEEGIARGELRPHDPGLAAGSIMGMLFFYATMGPVAIPALELESDDDLAARLAEHTIAVLMDGLADDGGD